MASVKLRNVYKFYKVKRKEVEAVRNLNLEIRDNEIVALLGPSGCGKTSTLRMIAGLEEISRGELYINDELSNKLPPARRNVALAFEDYALYYHLPVRENITFCLKSQHLNNKEINKRLDDICQLLGLGEVLDRRPMELSGGHQQRISLARALIRRPSIFLLDEPISHLELDLRYQILANITEVHYQTGTTMLYVTHNQSEAVAVGERIGVMNLPNFNK